MEQLGIDFSAPPFRGNTIQAKHASWTGARAVVSCLPARVSAYLQVVENAGAISDHEAAVILGMQLCSINSIRGGLEKQARKYNRPPVFKAAGFDIHEYWEGGKQRITRRTRWAFNR